ncbi:CRTAC1 family protein [Pelagibaculum spongiae]|uniref:ASPIC/UnbV domain-containing protein n=1 Tax=Pelagibaculum spongiae TaxID=2080658 RepID=A0A2V1GR13_9GAMM|nr:CRTAC1 family protein [Pelagibaculum spongiae]PVZ63410.1 hypothetical protein DC094_21105 [Pelagibaculum spongiae]
MNKKQKQKLLAVISIGSALALTGCDNHSSDESVTLNNVSDKLSSFNRQSAPVNFAQPNQISGEGISGSAWLDYDNDGDLDLYLTNSIGFSNALLQNNNGEFTDVTAQAGLTSNGGNSAVVAGDIDNDGYIDLFASGEGFFAFSEQSPNLLYHNNGDGTFTNIAASAGVETAETAISAAMADINGDGLLDLFVSSPGHLDLAPALNPLLPSGLFGGPANQHDNKLYLNNGDLTYTDISASSGLGSGIGACSVAFNDYENDGDQDIYVGNCNDVQFRPTPIQLFRNNGDNTFTDVAVQAGVNLPGFWMSISFADIDNDGDDDFFASNFAQSTRISDPADDPIQDFRQHALFLNNGDNTYTDVADQLGLAEREFSWGSTFADVNNDGYQDLFFTGSIPILGVVGRFANPGYLFINNQNGGFDEASQQKSGGDLRQNVTSGVSKADYDNDGFVDLLVKTERFVPPGTTTVVDSGRPILLENQGNNLNSVTVKLQPSNGQATAVGAKIQVTTKAGTQTQRVYAGTGFASSDSPWPTFGLARETAAQISVTWADGSKESFGSFNKNQSVTLNQGTGTAISN